MNSEYRIIIGISSDIASGLAEKWLKDGLKVIGSYRNWNSNLETLSKYEHLKLIKLDFDIDCEFDELIKVIKNLGQWSVLVVAIGSQIPIGTFEKVNFFEWTQGVKVNFLDQMKIVHLLLPFRSKSTECGPSVLFFAGGGTNNSVNNYSAYTVSKISLIKMCELLSTELPSVKFSIIGPGWVKTKIHDATILDSGKNSGYNYEKTINMLQNGDLVSVPSVIESCEWVIKQKTHVVSGRNFSTKFDRFNIALVNELELDSDMYKLRRHKNNWVCE